ncbi:MAG: hypothetical protein IKG21_06430 [Atopobiaceae bacterium]|nr:hypothetical protein [Atopobiaceae bacterium]
MKHDNTPTLFELPAENGVGEPDENMVQRAHELNAGRDEWIARYPRPWKRIQQLARRDYAAGRRMCISRYVEDIRAHDWSGTDGSECKISNSLRAPLARKLCEMHPEYAGLLITRPSVCDVLTGTS